MATAEEDSGNGQPSGPVAPLPLLPPLKRQHAQQGE